MNLADWKKLDTKQQLNIYNENYVKLKIWRYKKCLKNVRYVVEN